MNRRLLSNPLVKISRKSKNEYEIKSMAETSGKLGKSIEASDITWLMSGDRLLFGDIAAWRLLSAWN